MHQDRATDLRPSAQGAETREQGPARVEPIIGAENRTDYLCRSAHVRNGLEAVGSEYCHHFRIAGTLRFIDYPNLFGFVRKQPNRRGYAESIVNEKGHSDEYTECPFFNDGSLKLGDRRVFGKTFYIFRQKSVRIFGREAFPVKLHISP